MLKITIACVGRIKEKYLTEGIREYSKRLGRYCTLAVAEAADEKTPDKAPEALALQIKKTEGERLLRLIPEGSYVIVLDLKGKMTDSEGFAKQLSDLTVRGVSSICFVIGGSLGLSQEVLSRANHRLCFSPMTFPHQLMRLILLEQIYRGFRIIHGEPYHK